MTERRRRTRKKELKHGDLFHVYIASDTPPEVCAFLSRLKQNGDFSYEILKIIEGHVRKTQGQTASTETTVPEQTAAAPLVPEQGVPDVETPRQERSRPERAASAPVEKPDASEKPEKKVAKPDPIQLLRQQRRAWVAGTSSQ